MSDTITTEIPVLDLVGADVAGLRARVNRWYDTPDWAPMWRTLKTVELRTVGVRNWVYWTWEPEANAGRYDCGYSGMTVDLAAEQRRSIEIEEVAR